MSSASGGCLPIPDRWFQGYVFDLDGTIYLGEQLLPGAAAAVRRVTRAGLRPMFVSNNTTRSALAYERKLRRLGVPANPGSVLTPAAILSGYLHDHELRRVHVLGEAPLRRFLVAEGFQIVATPEEVECVVVSFDRTLTYRKLLVAHRALERGARFIAANPDRFCPMPDGAWPDAGATIGALEASTGRRVEAVLGKPSPLILEAALDRLGLPPERCLMVGDRLDVDVRMARAAGTASALVLTGAAAGGVHIDDGAGPDYLLSTLHDLLPAAGP